MEGIIDILEIFDIFGLVLYSTIGLIIAAHFRYLRLNIDNHLHSILFHVNRSSNRITKDNDNSNFSFRLKKWRRTYTVLLDTLNLFQICFDQILFFWTVFIFIAFINNTFVLVNMVTCPGTSINLKGILNTVVYLTKNAINLLVLSIIPVIIHREVRTPIMYKYFFMV